MNIEQPTIQIIFGYGQSDFKKALRRMIVNIKPGETFTTEDCQMYVHYPVQQIEYRRTDKTTAVELTDEEKELLRQAIGLAVTILDLNISEETPKASEKVLALIELQDKIEKDEDDTESDN